MKETKKLVGIMITWMLSMMLFCATACAGNNFAGGNGTKANPYKVATAEQLKRVASYNGSYFVQIKDIDLNNAKVSRLFGKGFYGVYDGKGYTIKNAKTSGKYAFLISSIAEDGVIQNVGFENITVNGVQRAALIGSNEGTVSKVIMTKCTISAKNQHEDIVHSVAGLCLTNKQKGIIKGCKLRRCTVQNNVDAWEGSSFAAGLVYTNKGSVSTCYVSNLRFQVTSVEYEARGAGLVYYNTGKVRSCKLSLKGFATSFGDKDGRYGAVEYGRMARLAYYNKGSIDKCTTTGTFEADKPVRKVYLNKGVVND